MVLIHAVCRAGRNNFVLRDVPSPVVCVGLAQTVEFKSLITIPYQPGAGLQEQTHGWL